MVHIKDLLRIAPCKEANLADIMREIPKVPETKPISELLKELQKSHGHQAIVMDEYGGTAGLVTLEDIIEELIGEIQDEYDRPLPIDQTGPNEFLVAPSASLSDVQEQIGLSRPEELEFETIGGYVFHRLGLKRAGASAIIGRYEITVDQLQTGRIRRLRIRVLGGNDPDDSNTNDT
jgi:CBS domain containing-hemolysin-like protein